MNPEDYIRQSPRTPFQHWIADPIVALEAVLLWVIFKVLPTKWASALGGQLGRLAGLIMRRRNHIALVNLGIAFPEKSEAERKDILRKMWIHWGHFYAEMPHTKTLFRQAEFHGLPFLKEAIKTDRGGFVCSAHIGNWELAVSQPLFEDFYLNPVYRRANNPWLDKLMFQKRKGTLIPKGIVGARKIVEVLHKKGFIAILCDQKLREGISVPFFGKPAMTAPAIAALALKFKAPILMARSIRQADGHYIVTISKELDIPQAETPAEQEYQIMLKINQQIESWIRENPEQWLWVHRRFDKSEYI